MMAMKSRTARLLKLLPSLRGCSRKTTPEGNFHNALQAMDHRRVVEGRVISEFPDAETFTLLLGDQATEQSSSVRVRLMSL